MFHSPNSAFSYKGYNAVTLFYSTSFETFGTCIRLLFLVIVVIINSFLKSEHFFRVRKMSVTEKYVHI